MYKKFVGGLCGAAVVLSMFGATAGSKAPFIEKKADLENTSLTKNVSLDGIEVKFNGTNEIHPDQFVADYKEVTYRSLKGEKATISIDGANLKVDAGDSIDIEVAVTEYYTGEVVARETASKTLNFECASKMKENVAYYIQIDIDFVANEVIDDALILAASGGKLYYVKSPVYDYNISKFALLRSDDDYLAGCLVPETDMECDNPDIIRISNEICADTRTNYEKVDKIYSYIVDEMYYDYDQLRDANYSPYEDDALSLLRRNIAVCEGFSNVFVALCRAQGIPATETFGGGYEYDELWALNMETVVNANHAWVAVFLDGEWLILDPTWDNANGLIDGELINNESGRNYVYTPIEAFSFTHIFFDADISHGTVGSGSCGEKATYEIDENGVCTIYGEGSVCLPEEVSDFTSLVFDKNSKITEIESEAFLNCDMFTSVIIPDTVETIGDYAFYHCENLQYVYIPDSVYSIGKNAFWTCDKLSYVEVPDGTYIGERAFNLCPRLVLSVENSSQISMSDYDVPIAKLITRD